MRSSSSCCLLPITSRPSNAVSAMLAPFGCGYSLLVIGYWLLVTRWLLTASHGFFGGRHRPVRHVSLPLNPPRLPQRGHILRKRREYLRLSTIPGCLSPSSISVLLETLPAEPSFADVTPEDSASCGATLAAISLCLPKRI